MKRLGVALLIALVTAPLCAQAPDVSTKITVVFFQCLNPKNDPSCVSPDERSKPTCCPSCKTWEKINISSDVTMDPKEKYGQPNAFVNDAAKQMYGTSLPKTAGGGTITVAQLYANPAKYGWVEVEGNTNKEGTMAVLPTTAGVVVKQTSPADITVVYSSTKKKGAVREIDLDDLTPSGQAPKYLVPKDFLTRTAATSKRHEPGV
jgi:hypothetical protein